jgi:transposase InsO family protein
VIEESLRK